MSIPQKMRRKRVGLSGEEWERVSQNMEGEDKEEGLILKLGGGLYVGIAEDNERLGGGGRT